MADFLNQILIQRQKDLNHLGANFGELIPKKRNQPPRIFLKEKGIILEIKRKSPSKGEIASHLNAVETANIYARNQAAAISILTERHFFNGSLMDLIQVAQNLNIENPPALLRKDFLLNEKEIEISYLSGADAILLIARILTENQLLKMAQTAVDFNLGILLEVRSDEDLNKLFFVFQNLNRKNYSNHLICGVNARDLSSFSMDLLYPLKMKEKIEKTIAHLPIVFESGILTKSAAALPALMGFYGILLGEAAAKNPLKSKELIYSFKEFSKKENTGIWTQFLPNNKGALVKICGLTRIQDVQLAAQLGADFVGFVLAEKSPRLVQESFLRDVHSFFQKNNQKNPLRVGVIANENEINKAIDYFQKGFIDLIQFHEVVPPDLDDPNYHHIPRFPAVILNHENDLEKLKYFAQKGYPRILIDAGKGSGKRIGKELILNAQKITPLWLAGGINTDNIENILTEWHPELIDLSSSLEEKPGEKSAFKMQQFFQKIRK